MSNNENGPHIRVNGEMLSSLKGRNVSVLGYLKKISPDQTSFELTTCDHKSVLVKLKVPIRDSLTEVVEVYGTVDGNSNINCTNYSTFESSATQGFDMELYNETLQMMYQLPKHYIINNSFN